MAGLLIAGTGSAFGCLNRPIATNEPRTTSTIVERLTQSSVDKIDLLLAIDNSGSMADKQDILATAIPDLVQGLVNPRCIHKNGTEAPRTVSSPNEDCPPDFKREFEPVKDIHIGIISSSLGGHGSGACQAMTSASNVDMAHLLARTDEDSTMNDIPTYLNRGFLAWDPDQKKEDAPGQTGTPDEDDGEADIEGDTNADLNDTSLVEQLTAMVKGTGQAGCGFEAQLESVYRFLVDPEPYESIVLEGDNAVPKGVDSVVMTQRSQFLRPSSLLAIIMLSDENDCSIREEGRNYLVAETSRGFRLWRPRTECATDPGHECCRSCSQKQDGCPVDPACTGPDGNPARLSAAEDPVNSRCWDQKRRFGFDFLYPIDRYRRAFTEAQIPNRKGELVPNPLFSDPNPDDGDSTIRDPGLVFFAGIVGVPWQDIARLNEAGEPDLLQGLNENGEPVGGFKNATELGAPLLDNAFASTWELILGDPANYQPPKDPFMVESTAPRSGMNPITGDTIVPPGQAGWNTINGREYTIPPGSTGDLQYACIFDLPESKSCEGSNQSCDCRVLMGQTNDNPLCQPEAGNDQADPEPRTTTQIKAKAYPGLRELQLIRELGPQGIVGSVCPAQLENTNGADYGYRPAIGAIIDRLKTVLGGQCLPRTLTPDEGQQVSCLILEARNSQGQCNCLDPRTPGRTDVTPTHQPAKDEVLSLDIAKVSGWDCVCEIQQLEGKDPGTPAVECRTNVNDNVESGGQPVHGWCYVDPSIRLGDEAIVADCPSTERRKIRFTGKGEAQQGATLFITCSGE
ncbi:hypothetical protein [Sorangium sp. So ce1078]|uniref:hypothetical protein n=1 Tax=Sorangium sp. So ce1078 TaxID=3133329 RepID=UPI003F63794E